MNDLDNKDAELLTLLQLFTRSVAQEVQKSSAFALHVGEPMKDYFDAHINDPRIFAPLEDDEQLKSRYLRVIYKLEPVMDLINDDHVQVSAATRVQMQTLYKNFRNACAEQAGIPMGQERA